MKANRKERSVMSTQVENAINQRVFRKTNAHAGRHISVTPDNSSMRHLQYGRIQLSGSHPTESFSTGNRETGLICLSGEARVTVERTTVERTTAEKEELSLGQYDAVYIPRDSFVGITTKTSVDLAEFSANVSQRYPLQVVRFSEISG